MPKLTIKGSFDSKGVRKLDVAVLEGDCQTCGADFEITIPYDLHAPAGAVQHVITTAKADGNGQRTIKGS